MNKAETQQHPIPFVSDAKPETGHLEEFNTMPLEFMHRAYNECGEICEFDEVGMEFVCIPE